jgi:hypothetical protein
MLQAQDHIRQQHSGQAETGECDPILFPALFFLGFPAKGFEQQFFATAQNRRKNRLFF